MLTADSKETDYIYTSDNDLDNCFYNHLLFRKKKSLTFFVSLDYFS